VIADWPARKRQAAAGTLAGLIDAIQRDLATEDEAAENGAGDAATAAPAYTGRPSTASSMKGSNRPA